MSGPDLGGRSSEENVVTQQPQGEVHGAFGGQTEIHQKQSPGPTHVPKDESTAHLSEESVQNKAQDIKDKVQEEYKTRIQEAQRRLEHLSFTDSKAGLEGTTHAIKSEVREKAQNVKGRRESLHVKGVQTEEERMSFKDIQEDPEGIMYLTESSTGKEVHDIKYQQGEELKIGVSSTMGCERGSKLIFSVNVRIDRIFLACTQFFHS